MRNITGAYLTKVSATRYILWYDFSREIKKLTIFLISLRFAANYELDLSFHFALFILCNIIIITIIVTINTFIIINTVQEYRKSSMNH